jgi:predicted GNAT superfamily acetyltransferase
MVNSKEIEIRSLYSAKELEEVRKLESKIWGENDSIPSHQTLTAVKNGGLVLGAFYQNELVGFQYSFPGFNGKSIYLCSHILGIDEQFRKKGIGEKLKAVQREEAIKLGYSLITWTYDPLESVNAYLNMAKLGGTCSTYLENCYGEMDDLLNSGIPSDRFLVEWNILQEEPIKFHKEVDIEDLVEESIIQFEMSKEGFPTPISTLLQNQVKDEYVYVAIPKDFQGIKNADLQIAKEWRKVTREVFQSLFEVGFQVIDFRKNTISEIPVQFYILNKI